MMSSRTGALKWLLLALPALGCVGEVSGGGGDDDGSDAGPITPGADGSTTPTPDGGAIVSPGDPLVPDLSHACDPATGVFFVAPTGSDSAAGSQAAPWKTLGKAASTLTAGQTACVAPGQYSESLTWNRAGTAAAPISIIGQNATRDSRVVGELQLGAAARYVRLGNLKLRASSTSNEALTILGARNVELINIELSDSNKMWWSSVDGLLLAASWIHHNTIGIDCTPGPCRNVTIVGTIIECAGYPSSGGCGPATSFSFGGPSDGVGAEADTANWRIIRSIARFNRTDGFDIKGSNITIEDSMAYGNGGGGFKIWGGGQTSVSNSLAFHNHNGVELYEASGASYRITNVTSADNDLAALAVYYDNGHFPTTVNVTNSIFAFSTEGNSISPSVTWTGSNNLYWADEDEQLKGGTRAYTKADVTAGRMPDSAAMLGDPRFVRKDSGLTSDYHLLAGSPASDSGTATGAPPADLGGQARPSGGGVDVGAYEGQ